MGRKNDKIAKTALGAEESVSWQQFADTQEAIAAFPAYTPVVIEQTSSALPYTDYFAPQPLYIFGNETGGVSHHTLRDVATHIALPMHGSKESLNVTTTVAVVLYHYLTQRNIPTA